MKLDEMIKIHHPGYADKGKMRYEYDPYGEMFWEMEVNEEEDIVSLPQSLTISTCKHLLPQSGWFLYGD